MGLEKTGIIYQKIQIRSAKVDFNPITKKIIVLIKEIIHIR